MRIIGTTAYPVGTLYSDDNGETWAFGPLGDNYQWFELTCMYEANGTIIAGTDYSETDDESFSGALLFRSVDNGETWTKVAEFSDSDDDWDNPAWYFRSVAGDGHGNWVAVSWDTAGYQSSTGRYAPYMAKSTDDGLTWEIIARPTSGYGVISGDEIGNIAVGPDGRWVGYINAANGGPGVYGLFMLYSDDMFSSWHYTTGNLWETALSYTDFLNIATDGEGNFVAVTQSECRFLDCMAVYFMYSHDNGESWTISSDTCTTESFGSGIALAKDGTRMEPPLRH